MRAMFLGLAVVCFTTSSALAQAPAAKAAPSIEDTLKVLRSDMQGSKADLMAKNLTLTAEQAAKFWPVFEAYQKEQNPIMDEQLKGIQKYADSVQTLDDAAALALMNAHLERDAKITALRVKWLAEFQKALPARLAVRAMQIDRRLSLIQQLQITTLIPLAH